MLIDCSYFTSGSRHILNASIGTKDTMPNHNAIEVNKAIEAYIAELQERFLTLMLGKVNGKMVNAYLAGLDEDADIEHNNAMDAVCGQLREAFADYVFFHIIRDANTQSTITGLVRLKSANDYVAPIRRQVTVWNDMVDKNRMFVEWCHAECTLPDISISSSMLTKINTLNL